MTVISFALILRNRSEIPSSLSIIVLIYSLNVNIFLLKNFSLENIGINIIKYIIEINIMNLKRKCLNRK